MQFIRQHRRSIAKRRAVHRVFSLAGRGPHILILSFCFHVRSIYFPCLSPRIIFFSLSSAPPPSHGIPWGGALSVLLDLSRIHAGNEEEFVRSHARLDQSLAAPRVFIGFPPIVGAHLFFSSSPPPRFIETNRKRTHRERIARSVHGAD